MLNTLLRISVACVRAWDWLTKSAEERRIRDLCYAAIVRARGIVKKDVETQLQFSFQFLRELEATVVDVVTWRGGAVVILAGVQRAKSKVEIEQFLEVLLDANTSVCVLYVRDVAEVETEEIQSVLATLRLGGWADLEKLSSRATVLRIGDRDGF